LRLPRGIAYEPLWKPGQEITELNLAGSGITSIIWCIGFQPDFTWVEAPCSTAAAIPAISAG
jgi:putative flavoprotein involved in K+ transport